MTKVLQLSSLMTNIFVVEENLKLFGLHIVSSKKGERPGGGEKQGIPTFS